MKGFTEGFSKRNTNEKIVFSFFECCHLWPWGHTELTFQEWPKWKSLSCLFVTAVHGILQATVLEWVAFPFSRGSSQPRDWTRSPALQADSLPAEPQGKPKNTGVGSLSLLQGIFPTQESNWGLLHCRQILYQLSYQGSPDKWPKERIKEPVWEFFKSFCQTPTWISHRDTCVPPLPLKLPGSITIPPL